MNKERKPRKGKKPTQIWWTPDMLMEIKQASTRAGESVAAWLRRAARAQLRKEKMPNTEKWPVCSICGRKHDSSEHFGGGTE